MCIFYIVLFNIKHIQVEKVQWFIEYFRIVSTLLLYNVMCYNLVLW